jgi:hypothetical protein
LIPEIVVLGLVNAKVVTIFIGGRDGGLDLSNLLRVTQILHAHFGGNGLGGEA